MKDYHELDTQVHPKQHTDQQKNYDFQCQFLYFFEPFSFLFCLFLIVTALCNQYSFHAMTNVTKTNVYVQPLL